MLSSGLSPIPGRPCRQQPQGAARQRCRRTKAAALQEHWLARLTLAAPAELGRLELVQLWLGVFAVSWRQLPEPAHLQAQVSAIERHLDGHYVDLLTAMVLNPAVQVSLNGPANQRRRPNENLARELLELFSLGQGSFSEADVRDAARALTGFVVDRRNALVFRPRRHDPRAKTILGRRERFGARSLVRWLCDQPATARTIAGRVWRQVLGGPPPAGALQELASAWQATGLSLPWLMRTLQARPEAALARRHGLKLLDPIPVVIRSLRLLRPAHREVYPLMVRQLRLMGQAPFEPPSVEGWPENGDWLEVRALQARRRGLAALLAHEEIWESSAPPPVLQPELTPIPPLGLRLPVRTSRETLAQLFSDPVWQFAGPLPALAQEEAPA
ncbi:DUF1800 family protein [Synechococcus sp. RSCCF101]|uniref:DUF1800 family protein n=1 Tax=Synechococcus sp. RSCCF101 TaxID=2511069 RepID=UPI001249182E|nr:DUF1800 family protein [Synechococcus sp. RSCCF101]QEY32432.1 DUF1800 family protein [Synechococcus sp. RSCCF101]